MSTPVATTFDEVQAVVADVEGWMTPAQAKRLWTRGRTVRPGRKVVEIGSFRGRSMIVLASAAAEGVELYAIDPHAGNDRGPHEFEGFEEQAADDHQVFVANLEKQRGSASGSPTSASSRTMRWATSTARSTCCTSMACTASSLRSTTSAAGDRAACPVATC